MQAERPRRRPAVRSSQLRIAGGLVCAVLSLTGCGESQPLSKPGTEARPSKRTPRLGETLTTGTLKGIAFKGKPYVTVTLCPTGKPRGCFPAAYVVYARLDTAVPRRSLYEDDVSFSLSAATREIDPIGRPPRSRFCYVQAFLTLSPGSAASPVADGAPVQVEFSVFDRSGDTLGTIATTVRLRQVTLEDSSEPAALRRVGCYKY